MRAAKPGVFAEFGGHAFSGGFSVSNDSIFNLEKELEVALGNLPIGEKNISIETHDAELSVEDILWKTYDAIATLAPFGIGNPKPIFLFRNAVVASAKKFGKEKNHFEITLKKTKGIAKAIKFFAGEEFSKISEDQNISFLGNLEKSTFGNKTELRVRILELI